MTVNEYFMKYYNPTKSGVNRKHKLMPIIQHGWCLSYEQVICDCLIMGYSLCVVEPLVEGIYKQMDEEFAEWEPPCEARVSLF